MEKFDFQNVDLIKLSEIRQVLQSFRASLHIICLICVENFYPRFLKRLNFSSEAENFRNLEGRSIASFYGVGSNSTLIKKIKLCREGGRAVANNPENNYYCYIVL